MSRVVTFLRLATGQRGPRFRREFGTFSMKSVASLQSTPSAEIQGRLSSISHSSASLSLRSTAASAALSIRLRYSLRPRMNLRSSSRLSALSRSFRSPGPHRPTVIGSDLLARPLGIGKRSSRHSTTEASPEFRNASGTGVGATLAGFSRVGTIARHHFPSGSSRINNSPASTARSFPRHFRTHPIPSGVAASRSPPIMISNGAHPSLPLLGPAQHRTLPMGGITPSVLRPPVVRPSGRFISSLHENGPSGLHGESPQSLLAPLRAASPGLWPRMNGAIVAPCGRWIWLPFCFCFVRATFTTARRPAIPLMLSVDSASRDAKAKFQTSAETPDFMSSAVVEAGGHLAPPIST